MLGDWHGHSGQWWWWGVSAEEADGCRNFPEGGRDVGKGESSVWRLLLFQIKLWCILHFVYRQENTNVSLFQSWQKVSRAAGVRELGALGDPEGSGVWDAACRARCCYTPAPSPASRGGAPGRMSGVWSAGWQRAGRGDAILRLQVQHPIMELQGECEGRQQHTTGQDYRWGRDDMITKRRPLTVPFLKPGRTLKSASLMTFNPHPQLRAGDSRRHSHVYTWTEDMRIERLGIGARARKPSGGRWVPGIEVLNVLIFKQKKRSHIAHIFTM